MTALSTSRPYVPVMLANLRAVTAGASTVEAVVDGAAWQQQPFPYQAKCLRCMREAHAALEPSARRVVDDLLAGTGCERLLAA